MAIIGIILLILAVALMVIGALATFRKLPGNSVIGLRVEEVRKDQRTWEVAHAVAGPIWFLGAVALFFGGLAALQPHPWTWLITVAGVIVAVLAISVGANMGARAAFLQDKANEDAEKPAVDLGALRTAARRADNA